MLYRRVDNHEMSGEAAIQTIQFILETAEPGQTWSLNNELLVADKNLGATVSHRVTTEDASAEHLQCFIDVANTVWGGMKPEPSAPLVQDLRV